MENVEANLEVPHTKQSLLYLELFSLCNYLVL